MGELFSDIPEALENSWEIVKRCNLSLVLDKPCLPNYPVPKGMDMEQYFSELSSDGLRERLRTLYGDDYET